jgi:hypothetical protein
MAAFTWESTQWVRHASGYEVFAVGRFTMVYEERGERLTIAVGHGRSPGGRFSVTVAAGAFGKWDGSEQALAPDEQERIERNFTAALAFMEIDVVKPGQEGDFAG